MPANISNCLSINYYGLCSSCSSGYVLVNVTNGTNGTNTTTDATCRRCSIHCSSCLPENITHCANCTLGYELKNGKCSPCPDKCLNCSNSVCVLCADGLTLNANNVCVLKCKLPCLSCADNQPTVCTKCQMGSNLVNNQCVFNTTCASDYTCSYCGQGLNYYLNLLTPTIGNCSICPSIANCIQCSSNDTTRCIAC